MPIIENIHLELKKNIDKKYKADCSRFFKGGLTDHELYGVRTPIARRIASKYWKEVKGKDKKEIFGLCEELLSSRISEPLTIAFQWALDCRKEFEKPDFEIFQGWLEKYVDNWAKCDDLCCKPLGFLVLDFPELLPKVFEWTENSNIWFRRASVVCLIPSVRKKNILENIFKTADSLILDQEDLVQKGYGWMLKEASKNFQKEIFDYVMKNKNKMTRTALRYAIEKLPQEMKEKAME